MRRLRVLIKTLLTKEMGESNFAGKSGSQLVHVSCSLHNTCCHRCKTPESSQGTRDTLGDPSQPMSTQVNPSQPKTSKATQVNPSRTKSTQVDPSQPKSTQVNSSNPMSPK
ncbi:hypothetical protein DPMN_154981 [Dreissena polymorpha]|uniref:Uncharacterized protein n=1 Tax=Dreissena polymorpha TaxID=45954 RepID=A0A9D4JAG8_DREPO|nr:hypothetical protein DPMN_154981 [Dreissena polymorpha]